MFRAGRRRSGRAKREDRALIARFCLGSREPSYSGLSTYFPVHSSLSLFDTDVVCTGSRLDSVDTAADHLSHAIALEPRFWPALVEKARLWAAVGDWEQVRTTVEQELRCRDVHRVPTLCHGGALS